MAATETQHSGMTAPKRGSERPPHSPAAPRSPLEPARLLRRADEEVSRASRHDTPLCALLLRLDEFETLQSTYGDQLAQAALLHAAEALSADLRRFDRVGRAGVDQLLLLLPGARLQQGEVVARRALTRLHSIKIEVGRCRRSLLLSIGIAEWRPPWSAQRLVDEARCAAGVLHRDHLRD